MSICTLTIYYSPIDTPFLRAVVVSCFCYRWNPLKSWWRSGANHIWNVLVSSCQTRSLEPETAAKCNPNGNVVLLSSLHLVRRNMTTSAEPLMAHFNVDRSSSNHWNSRSGREIHYTSCVMLSCGCLVNFGFTGSQWAMAWSEWIHNCICYYFHLGYIVISWACFHGNYGGYWTDWKHFKVKEIHKHCWVLSQTHVLSMLRGWLIINRLNAM